MLQLKNQTPFQAALAKFPNASGVDTLYVVVTATFKLWPKLAVHDEQQRPVLSDEYRQEPGTSSLRYAGELHLGKPSTDVIVVGHAQAPDGVSVTELQVGLRVAERTKVVQVYGDRHWRSLGPSPPRPFSRMPLVYERAFGGSLVQRGAASVVEARNPVGVGLAIGRACAANGEPLPNIEDPRSVLAEGRCPAPAGFGCIAPAWLPRRGFAGTYDDRWQRTRAPYLPEDFQLAYFNCASSGLVFDGYLHGGEPLRLVGMSERGPLQSALPRCTLGTVFVVRGERHARPSRMQTVLIEPDDNRLCLTFHAQFECDKVALDIDRVEISLDGVDLNAIQ